MFGGGCGGSNYSYVPDVPSTYYSMINVQKYDAIWRNSIFNVQSCFFRIEDLLQDCANYANSAISGEGHVIGSQKHKIFSEKVQELQIEDILVEQSYINKILVPYGTKGSVRFDVILVKNDMPVMAWDFKTGNATLSNARIQKMRNISGFHDLSVYALYGR